MSISYNPKVVTEGLQLYLDAANKRSYPGSGTNWKNLKDNTNIPVLGGSPTYDSTTNFGVFDCNGSTDDWNVSSVLTDSFLQGDWTIGCWVNFDTISTTTNGNIDKTILQHGVSTNNNGLHLAQRDSGIRFGLYSNDSQSSVTLTTLQWYNINFTIMGDTPYTKQLFFNGVKDTGLSNIQPPGNYTGTGSNSTLCGVVLNFGLNFDGKIAIFYAYNRVLTDSEITRNFNTLRGRFGI